MNLIPATSLAPEEERARYRELLEELRTVIPGAQVLLAFLLAESFTTTFGRLDEIGRDVFAGVLLGTALATILFMTPAAYHRVARRSDRGARLHFAIRLTIAGMTVLTLSVGGAVFVVVRFIFASTALGVAFAATVMATSLLLWYASPCCAATDRNRAPREVGTIRARVPSSFAQRTRRCGLAGSVDR